MRGAARLLAAAALGLAVVRASSVAADDRPAPAATAERAVVLPIGKCMNLSNMLEAPVEGAWGPKLTDDDFRVVKAAGFATVRMPIQWPAHAQAAAPYAIDPAFLARVHHLVDVATAERLNVILDLHNYDALMADSSAELPRFVALWRQVAASFADAAPNVWFELLNEPYDKLTAQNLPRVLGAALAAVRESNPTRPVIIGGGDKNSFAALLALPPPSDPNVVLTFHYYAPFAFTHQGSTWTPHAPPFGRAYGGPADRAELARDVARLKAYMARTGRTPFLGEYGAQSDPRVPLDQRVAYYGAVSRAFASLGVASCAWGYRSGFQTRDGDHWLPGLVDAMAAPTP